MENVMTTKELFDKFFEGRDENYTKRVRSQVDREEVYVYEEKISKQLVEMEVEELLDMLNTFSKNRNIKTFKEQSGLSPSTFRHIVSIYRSIFNFYIDNYKVIRNPFNDSRMKGVEAAKRLSNDNKKFDLDTINEAIDKLYSTFETNRAEYLEMIMRMYLDGFAKAEEIVNLKEDMINYKDKSVILPGRTVHLSDRTFELMNRVQRMDNISNDDKSRYVFIKREGYYFKYIALKSKSDNFFYANNTELQLGRIINRYIITNVKNKFGININYRNLFLLGFYEQLKKEYGENRARELLISSRNPDDARDLMISAYNFGVVASNITNLKRDMYFLL